MDAGQPYELFWQLTLREISAILDGVSARLIREHNDRAWMVWHTEALSRQKKLPKLQTLLAGQKQRQQTVEDQIRIAMQWTAAVQRKR